MSMNSDTQCPKCGSLNGHVTQGYRGFQSFGRRYCDDCGTAWRLACPRWAAILSIVTGCVMLAGAWAGIVAHRELGGVLVFVLLGLWASLYGVGVLLGLAGQIRILGQVPSPPALESSESGVCAGCQRSVPPGSAYCPHCGREQSAPG